MLIFAGLGNPGPKHARHRHNIGYMVADEIIRRHGFRLAQARHHSYIATGEKGITLEDLLTAVREEFKENEDLPNTTNPDDWARISGRKGERIINVRTLMTGISRKERSIENITSGQYL